MSQPTIDQQVTFLYTKNLSATAAFYQTILGLPLILDQGSCHIYEICPNGFIGFCTRGAASQDAPVNPGGVILTLVSRHVDDWYSYLQAQNVPIEKAPTLNKEYNIYHLFLRDPNGYLVEIQSFLDPAWPQPHKLRPK